MKKLLVILTFVAIFAACKYSTPTLRNPAAEPCGRDFIFIQ